MGIGLTLHCHLHRHFLKHPIDRVYIEVYMPVQAGAKAVDESDCANVQRRFVHLGRTLAMALQCLRNHP